MVRSYVGNQACSIGRRPQPTATRATIDLSVRERVMGDAGGCWLLLRVIGSDDGKLGRWSQMGRVALRWLRCFFLCPSVAHHHYSSIAVLVQPGVEWGL